MMMFVFARFIPMLAVAELKELWYKLYHGHNGHGGVHAHEPKPTAPAPQGGGQ